MANDSVWIGRGTISTTGTVTDGAIAVFDGTTGLFIKSGAGGGGYVASIAGTANQITASAATGAVTLSIPSAFIAPGSIAATTTLSVGSTTGGLISTAATGITTAYGDLRASYKGTDYSPTIDFIRRGRTDGNIWQWASQGSPGDDDDDSLELNMVNDARSVSSPAIAFLRTGTTGTLTRFYARNMNWTNPGPHVIGSTVNLSGTAYASNTAFLWTGGVTANGSAGTVRGLYYNQTLTLTGQVGQSAYGVNILPVFVGAASGTHAEIDGTLFTAPTYTGAATVTTAATVAISAAPTFGGTNYALWIKAGNALISSASQYQIDDANKAIAYSATVDGLAFHGFGGFIWKTGTAGATEQMRLTSSALTVVPVITANAGVTAASGQNITVPSNGKFVVDDTNKVVVYNSTVDGLGIYGFGGVMLKRGTAGATEMARATSSGFDLKEGVYLANGTAGVTTFGPSIVTSITIKAGIVTAIS